MILGKGFLQQGISEIDAALSNNTLNRARKQLMNVVIGLLLNLLYIFYSILYLMF